MRAYIVTDEGYTEGHVRDGIPHGELRGGRVSDVRVDGDEYLHPVALSFGDVRDPQVPRIRRDNGLDLSVR